MRLVAYIAGLGLLVACGALAESALPAQLEQVGIEQRLGETVPLTTRFVAADGAEVALGDYFGGQPVLLVPVYYDCPMLCTIVLEGLTKSLKAISLEPGVDFQVLAVSFDSNEGPEQASRRLETAVKRYGRAGARDGLHFLTGDEAAVRAVMDSIGFHFRRDEETQEFAHAAAVVVLTPDGRVARYFLGVEYPPRDLRLSLVEAADRRIGTAVDKVLLYCFRYDPTTGRYTAATLNLVRAGAILTLALVGAFVILNLRRERSHHQPAGADA